MERRTVKFYSEGIRLEGDLYLPSDLKAGDGRPGIVLCHGFTGLRELILSDYAKVFADAGFVAFTFDYRGFGGSEGEKWRLIPLEQIDDIRNAISFLEAQPQVDPERIGLWGTSFGGANAPYAAAVDSRVKAVVGQVGFGDGARFMLDVRNNGERVERCARWRGAVALLIRIAALLASASFSKPNTAEYLRPTTCAITKLMLIPASPTALAIVWPSPGRLSPSITRVEMDEGARPAVCAAAADFLPETGYSSMAALLPPG